MNLALAVVIVFGPWVVCFLLWLRMKELEAELRLYDQRIDRIVDFLADDEGDPDDPDPGIDHDEVVPANVVSLDGRRAA